MGRILKYQHQELWRPLRHNPARPTEPLRHGVTVYERDEGPGGLMRFSVPDAKLEKWVTHRRVAILEQEDIESIYDSEIGRDILAEELQAQHECGSSRDRLATTYEKQAREGL